MDESFQYLIAIDGGGTKCRFAMVTPDGRVEVTLGSANAFSDRQKALRTLDEGLQALADKAQLPRAHLAEIPTYAGLAGVTDAVAASEVARSLPSRIAEVEDDRRSAVVGALGARDGSVIGVGTGSFLARQADGRTQFIGGYGALIGDQASGNWLGVQLLQRVLLAIDGIQPHSALTRKISAEYDDDPMQIVAFVGQANPSDFAGLAPEIIAAAAGGDPVAQELMRGGADYLAQGLRALGHTDGSPICMIGGVAPHYADYLPPHMQASLTEAKGSPLDGALILARHLAERAKVGAG
jgi:glucosamine kinase